MRCSGSWPPFDQATTIYYVTSLLVLFFLKKRIIIELRNWWEVIYHIIPVVTLHWYNLEMLFLLSALSVIYPPSGINQVARDGFRTC